MEKSEDQKPTFVPEYYNIPGIVMHDATLQPLDIKVYGVVFWFERLKDGRCFASNQTIGKVCGSSASGVANSLARLRDAGYIFCEYEKDQRKSIRTLVYNTVNPYSNEEGGVTQMSNIVNNTNTRTFSCSTAEREQALDLHTGYVKLFKLDFQLYKSLTSEEQKTQLDAALKRYKMTDERLQKIVVRLRDAGYELCKRAIVNANKSEWNHGENPSGWKMDLYKYLFRNYEMVEDWGNRE